MSQATVDITEVLDRQKISGFNVRLVILAFLVMMTDGYDLGAAAFAAPTTTDASASSSPAPSPSACSRWPRWRRLRSISLLSRAF
jgi:hypothetical protein